MKHKLVPLPFLIILSSLAVAGPNDMTVSTWDAGCEHTMTTNHFVLEPTEQVELTLDLSGCSAAKLGGALAFGYHTTKNSSKPLNTRDQVSLELTEIATGQNYSSNSGSIFLDLIQPTKLVLKAKNNNRRKSIKIRLRFSSGLTGS